LAAAGAAPAIPARETTEARLQQQLADNQAEQALLEMQTLARIKLPENTKKAEVLVRHIRESVQKDPVAAANALRTWVTDMGKNA
jgi:flagellar biosynthesis/type III secretory pathway M-ring protein FliF/YscJ